MQTSGDSPRIPAVSLDSLQALRKNAHNPPSQCHSVGSCVGEKAANSGGLFAFWNQHITLVRTIAYVDGYNLYYGRLSDTEHKWLDIVQLMERLTLVASPTATLDKVRYFTAPVLARFARRGDASVNAQNIYHEALKFKHPDRFDIVLGYHQAQIDKMMRAAPPAKPSKDDRVDVWRLNEKQTDVNIALAMYRDAAQGRCDQIVLCSNDTDAEPVLKALKADFPQIAIGVVATVAPSNRPGATPSTPPMSSLHKYATWSVACLSDADLQAAQLPRHLPRPKRKPLRQPAHWLPGGAP